MTDRQGLARAQSLIEVRRYAEAQSALAALLATEPGSAEALILLAVCRDGLEDFAGMLAAADRAIAAAPDESEPYRLASVALRHLGRHAEAVDRAEVAVQLDPAVWYTHADLAIALSGIPDRREESYQVARTAVLLGPEESGAHFAVGLVASACYHWELAEKAYLRAAAIDPNNAAVHNNLALVRAHLDRPTDAWSGFRTALRSEPGLKVASSNIERHSNNLLLRASATLMVSWLILSIMAAGQVRSGLAGSAGGIVSRFIVGVIAAVIAVSIVWPPIRSMPVAERATLRQLVRATPSLRLGVRGLVVGTVGVAGIAIAPWPPVLVGSIVIGLAGVAMAWGGWVWGDAFRP